MAAEYINTKDVFAAIKGQIEDQLVSDDIDSVIVFGGSLEDAVESHFGQSVKHTVKAAVFFGFSDDNSSTLSGSGQPLRQEMQLDFYVIIRARGRGKYAADHDRLLDISDKMMFDVFNPENFTATMRARCPVMRFGGRRRIATGSLLMAHMLRFTATPKRSE